MFRKRTSKIAWGILIVVAACVSIFYDYQENILWYRIFKPLTTILIILFVLFFGKLKTQFAKWVLLALVFCLIGDTLLLFEAFFIFGLVSFLMAHLLFSISFIRLGGFKPYKTTLLPLVVIGAGYFFNLYEHLDALKIPVLCYLAVIIFMSWQGINLGIWKKTRLTLLLSVAVVLFLFSDSVLAWARFKADFPFAGAIILSTYWASIFLIAIGTASNELDEPQ